MIKFKGFTLIEFVLILIIISIISVIVITSLREPQDTNIELAAKKVANDIIYVRERAITSSKTHKIYLNTPDRFRAGFGNYTLITNPDNNSPFDINISRSYSNVSFFRNYSVRFDPLGIGRFNTMTSIELRAGTKSKIIKITPLTGRVYVQ